MRLSITSLLTLTLSYAFPAIHDVPEELRDQVRDLSKLVAEKRLLLNSLDTPIDVSGEHAFVAPNLAPGDQGGPCPGLNALANHGYIPHDGVVSLLDVTLVLNEVFGVGVELAAALAVLGVVWTGNPLSLNPSFSIGGPTDKFNNLLDIIVGLLGNNPRGLEGSHNIIEADSSGTRNDLYFTGDAWSLDMDLFMSLYNLSSDPIGDYNMSILAELANNRFTETVDTNPTFYYGPFTGLIARNAGYIFAARILSNHTVDRPEGIMTKETLKSFWAVSGDEGNFTYNYGHERIPENWYKVPVDYGLVQLNVDLVTMCLEYPQLLSIGGNTGTMNSFAGVDLGNLTGGIYEVGTLLENNNLLCFVFETVKIVSPNMLSTIFSTLDTPLQMLSDALMLPLLNFSCPALTDSTVGGGDLLAGLKELYPGVNKSGFAL